MKRHLMIGLLCSVALVGAVGVAEAMPAKRLVDGVSDTQLVSQAVRRFTIHVRSPAVLTIKSEGWDATDQNMFLRARLLDGKGNLVMSSGNRLGHFSMRTNVPRGVYTLEVRGQSFGGIQESEGHRYQIKTSILRF